MVKKTFRSKHCNLRKLQFVLVLKVTESYLALYHSLPTEGDACDAAAALHFRLG